MVIIFLFHILFFFPDKIQLVLRGEDIFEDLDSTQTDELWRPEFASYMLEGTPGQPYGSTLKDLLKVEKVRVTMNRISVNQLEYSVTCPNLVDVLTRIPLYILSVTLIDNKVTLF